MERSTMTLFLVLFFSSLPRLDARANNFETPDFLRKSQRDALRETLKAKQNHNIAKNVVLMIGDGMGVSTVTAARTYVGQLTNTTGEENRLSFERWPAVGLSVTYNLDRQVADSAGTAVAFMSGVKVNFGTLGVDGTVPYGKDCSKVSEATRLQTLLDYALAAEKSVGVVTTARITHATPAAAYAHVPYRNFEDDSKMAGDRSANCGHVKDIALQLVEDNPGIHVIMGGGRRHFHSNSSLGGRRKDGRNLIEEWKEEKRNRSAKHAFVDDTGCLRLLDLNNTDYLLGLFSDSHMSFEEKRATDKHGEPSLEEMVAVAIQILQRNPRGYFLLLESGRIDHAHHDTRARLALSETAMFDKAIQKVTSMTSQEDTLLTVTADHSHVFTISGYPERGNPILGTVNMPSWGPPQDDLPYLTLSYANGPNGRINESRTNYTGVDTTGIDFMQSANVKMASETHGGEDVAIYARGPMSHLFHSVHEQSYIAHVLMYAACLGDYGDDTECDRAARLQRHHGTGANNSSPRLQSSNFCLLFLILSHVDKS